MARPWRDNLTKCVFAQTEIKFLGYTVNEDGTKPLAKKVKAILDFPRTAYREANSQISRYDKFLPKIHTQDETANSAEPAFKESEVKT